MNRKTPCVGICSTTYGDLVCRGCKRFAHEVVQWNSYDPEQQTRIWARLTAIRDEVTGQLVSVSSEEQFDQFVEQSGVSLAAGGVYLVLQHLVAADAPLTSAGLVSEDPEAGAALAVIQLIDAEVYRRSVAHYERSFRIRA